MSRWGRKPSCVCGMCKKCQHAAYMRAWYGAKTFEERRALRADRNADRIRERDRARHAARKDDPDYQQRRRAVAKVNNAIRDGRLTRQPCEVCGRPAQGHHDDYDKPLDVRWLCTEHHAQHHAEEARAAA